MYTAPTPDEISQAKSQLWERSGMGDTDKTLSEILAHAASLNNSHDAAETLLTQVAKLEDGRAALENEITVLAVAALTFGPLGWTISGRHRAADFSTALEAVANGEEMAKAEGELTDRLESSVVHQTTASRVGGLGAADPGLRAISAARRELVELAIKHHSAGEYEAAVLLVYTQIDGLSRDATQKLNRKGGQSYFSRNAKWNQQADMTDQSTTAGWESSLTLARRWFTEPVDTTSLLPKARRHGVLHGRELNFGTRVNSVRAFNLLVAVTEWAQPVFEAEADRLHSERTEQWHGTDEVDLETGWRMDRRGFTAAREALSFLAFAQESHFEIHRSFGSMNEVRSPNSVDQQNPTWANVTIETATSSAWFGWVRSESGWVFGIGRSGVADYFFDGPDVPTSSPPDVDWREDRAGNWSGDCW